MIKVIVQTLRLFLECFHKVVDVVFALSAIKPAVVKRLLQAFTKSICLALDSIQQPHDLAITDPIWLAHDLPCDARPEGQRDGETTSKQNNFGLHGGYSSTRKSSWT